MAVPAPGVAATGPGREARHDPGAPPAVAPPAPARDVATAGATAARAPARPRGVLALAWPSLVENLLLMMLNTGSLMMVGRLGAGAMASVGASGQVSNVIIIVFSGIAAGTTALVARAVGAGNGAEARAIARQSLLVGVVVAAACGLLGVAFAPSLVGILGVAPEVIAGAAPLVRVASLLLPVLVTGILAGATLRGAGDTRTPMWNAGIANVINLGVAFVAIYGLGPVGGIGVDGVAAGWIAGQGASGLLGLRALARQRRGPLAACLDPLRRRDGWRIDLPVLRRVAAVGGPAAGEYASIQVGMIFFSMMVVRMGTAAFASQQAIFTAANVSMMPGLAFSVAATTLVGQHLGAGHVAAARAAGWRSTLAAMAWMTAAGVGFIAFPAQMLGVFTSDPDVIAAGATGIRMIGFGQPLQAAAFVLSGALRGAGDTRTTLVIGSMSMWIVRLGLAWTLGIGLGWGLAGIWLGWCADWCVRGTAYILAFHRGAWQKVNV